MEKAMVTHSSILAWRIPGTEEPGGLPSMGSQRVGHYWSYLAAAAYINIMQIKTKVFTLPLNIKEDQFKVWAYFETICFSKSNFYNRN